MSESRGDAPSTDLPVTPVQPLTPEQQRILRDGAPRLHDLQNIAAGYGRDVHALVRMGLLRCSGFTAADHGRTWSYERTAAGNAALEGHL